MKKCPYCAEEIQDEAIVCKHCGRDLNGGASQAQIVAPTKKTSPLAWGCLSILLLLLLFAYIGSRGTSSPSTSGVSATPPAAAPLTNELAFLSSRGGRSSDSYFTVEGQVQNLTDRALPSVAAVVTWYTKDNQFISSDTSLVEYDPLLPGQKSPFKVITRANPAMSNYTVEFKRLLGGPFRVEDRRKK